MRCRVSTSRPGNCPGAKRKRSIRSKKCSTSFDHEDHEQEIPSSVDISGNRSIEFEEKECVQVKCQKNRRQSRRTSDSEQLLTLEKSNLSDTSEENRKVQATVMITEVSTLIRYF